MNKTYILGAIGILALLALTFYIGKPSGVDAPAPLETTSETATTTEGSVTKTPAGNTGASVTTKPVGTAGTGRVVVTIVDEGASLESLQSLKMTITDISVLGTKGWVKVLPAPREVNALDLYRTSNQMLLADVGLAPGTYSAMRLSISKVVVSDKIGQLSAEAWMPSHTLVFNAKLTVIKAKTSAIALEIPSAKSLFATTNKSYLFFPVVRLTMQHDVGTVQTLGGNTQVVNGLTDFDQSWGMDELGVLKVGFSFIAATQFEWLGSVLHVIPYDEKKSNITFSAQSAITSASAPPGNYLDKVLTVQSMIRQNKHVWQVAGTKGGSMVKVYFDVTNGTLIAVE